MMRVHPRTESLRGVSDSSASLAACCGGFGSPRVLRMPADWWDLPSAVGCSLEHRPQSARETRRLTGKMLLAWGLEGLVEDAEIIVGELIANAVTHARQRCDDRDQAQRIRFRLMRRKNEVIFAVLDPSDDPPILRLCKVGGAESGRGLQMVDALADVWGWSPLAGRGKAVWAIQFCSDPSASPAEGADR